MASYEKIKSSMVMRGKNSINVIAYDDKPYGFKKIEIEDQTLICYHIPRESFSLAKDLSERCDTTGIYFLFNGHANHNEEFPIYVGQADKVITRLLKHDYDDEKIFDRAIVIVGINDEILDSTSIDWLESMFIQDVKKAFNEDRNIIFQNANVPALRLIRESDEIKFAKYASRIKWYIEFLNYDYSTVAIKQRRNHINGLNHRPEIIKQMDEVVSNTQNQENNNNELIVFDTKYNITSIDSFSVLNDNMLFRCRNKYFKDVRGYFKEEDGLFYVLKGSVFPKRETSSISEYTIISRQKCVELGYMQLENDYYTLNTNLAFKSPSSAIMFVMGVVINGRNEWINIQLNKALKDMYDE